MQLLHFWFSFVPTARERHQIIYQPALSRARYTALVVARHFRVSAAFRVSAVLSGVRGLSDESAPPPVTTHARG